MWTKPNELKKDQTICIYQPGVASKVDCIIENVSEIKTGMFLIEYKNNGKPLEHLDTPTIIMSYQKAFVVTLETKIRGLERYLKSARNYKQDWIDEIKENCKTPDEYYKALQDEDGQCQADAYETIGEKIVQA